MNACKIERLEINPMNQLKMYKRKLNKEEECSMLR